jgi:type IV pilus assembly protein PilN
MAHINLLPWREEERQKREKNFYITLGITFVVAAAVLYGAIMFVDALIEEQNQRNAFLEQEIRLVDKKIKEIKNLEKQRDMLVARMQVIEELQKSRPKIVKVMDALPRIVPEGVNLKTFSRTGKNIEFLGIAESNSRVSVFMTSLDKNVEFGESKLNIIKKSATKNDFSVNVQEQEPKKEEGAS